MEGFVDGQPIMVKVLWATPEVALLSGSPNAYGLLGYIATPGVPGGVTRYFVPWTAVSYVKQDIPAPAQAQAPVSIPQGSGAPVGGSDRPTR